MRLSLFAALTCQLIAAPAPISKGFDHFYNLEYDQAIAEFEGEIKRSPNDPYSYTHMAQALLYRELFNAGAIETEMVTGSNVSLARAKILATPVEQKRFDDSVTKAIALSEARLAANSRDTEALYALGVAHSLRSNYNFLVRKIWRESLREFTQSRKIHQQALQIKPDFVDAQFVEGVHDYIVGSLPFALKMVGFLIGFRGDKDGGIRTVELVAREGKSSRVDAMILLAVAYRRERQAEKAIPLLQQLIAMFPRNYIYRLEMVQMYADLGRKDEALAVLRTMEQLKTAGAAGYKNLPPGKIYYSRGNLLFWYREYTAAIADLRRVTAAGTEAGLNTLVNAWLRLGQCYDTTGRREDALRAYRQAIDGAPDSDAAKEARRYLSSAYRR
ncbi:MAG: tetratricopeptide repeat protein [Bryobacterales bacterium]|nr:tetratricopeptide repeat protein [Bryobacterales bacterium]